MCSCLWLDLFNFLGQRREQVPCLVDLLTVYIVYKCTCMSLPSGLYVECSTYWHSYTMSCVVAIVIGFHVHNCCNII